MRYIMLFIVIMSGGLFLLSSCDNSNVGPYMIEISGTYAYQIFDSSGTVSDTGILVLNQVDSTLAGEIHSQTESYMIRGQVNSSGYVQFSEKPEKILSPFWYGFWQSNTIRGYVEVNTGGRATPLSKQKFLAVRETIY